MGHYCVDHLWLLLPAIVIPVALIMRALANIAAERVLDRLSRRLHVEWNDETYSVLRLHFRAQIRATGLGLVVVTAVATFIALAVPWLVPASSAVDGALGALAALAVGLNVMTAITYARQADARGASRGIPARLRDVIHPFVLAALITGFTLCVLATVIHLILLASDTTPGTPTWGAEYAAAGALTCVAVAARIRFLPRHAVGLEYVYRFDDLTKIVGIGLTLPMLGAMYGFMTLSDTVEWLSPSGPALVLAFAYIGLALAASFVLEYRPYRVPEHSIQLLSETTPTPVEG